MTAGGITEPHVIMWHIYKGGVKNGQALQTSMGSRIPIVISRSLMRGAGWETCKQNKVVISKKFNVDGKEDPDAGRQMVVEQYKSECVDRLYAKDPRIWELRTQTS